MKRIILLSSILIAQYASATLFSGEALQNGDLPPAVFLNELHTQNGLDDINCQDKALFATLDKADEAATQAMKYSALKAKTTNVVMLVESVFPGNQSVPNNLRIFLDSLRSSCQMANFMSSLYFLIESITPDQVHAIDSRYGSRAFKMALDEHLKGNNAICLAVSFSDVLDELALRRNELLAIGKKRSELNSDCTEVIANITKYIGELQTTFAQCVLSKNSSLDRVIMPWDTADRYTHIHAPFLQAFVYLCSNKYLIQESRICDLITVDKILEAQAQKKPVLIIIGNGHSKRIKQALQRFGYQMRGSLAAHNHTIIDNYNSSKINIIDCIKTFGYPTEKDLRTFLDTHDGTSTKMATKIQAAYRGMQARKKCKKLKADVKQALRYVTLPRCKMQ